MKERTLREDFLRRLDDACERVDQAPADFARYRDDPAAFFREVLGIEPWARHASRTDKRASQLEIVQAAATEKRITVRSGHGLGKTLLVAGLCWWYVKTRGAGARVFLTSTKGEQSEHALWREVRSMWLENRKLLGGTMPKLGSTGWDGPEEEQILVLTADQAENLQGLRGRGARTMIVADEASAIDDRLFVAMQANLSGGGYWLLIGNPTRPQGFFFKSHAADSSWAKFHISSEDSPNYIERSEVVEGLVTYEWVEQARLEWDRADFLMRVAGEFVLDEQNRPITWAMIHASKERWAEAPEDGLLSIGLDVAGQGRDSTVFAVVRGLKAIAFFQFRKASEEQIEDELRKLVQRYRRDDGEIPRVVQDIDGIGASLGYRLQPLSARLRETAPRESFKWFGLKGSLPATRDTAGYDRQRDEAYANLVQWFERGGAIPPDEGKLHVELNAHGWTQRADGKHKISDKPKIAKMIGRSPDFADALALGVWDPEPHAAAYAREVQEMKAERQRPAGREDGMGDRWAEPTADGKGGIYEQLDPFQRERDPWGHDGR